MSTTGVKLKYGPFKGFQLGRGVTGYMGASEVISNASGRFVRGDDSGRLEIAPDGEVEIVGWVEAAAQTCSSTEGGTQVLFFPTPTILGVIFRIPIIAGTYATTMRNKTCDIAVSSNIQGAKLDASGEDNIIIVDGDAVNNAWVDVCLNPAKCGTTGVV